MKIKFKFRLKFSESKWTAFSTLSLEYHEMDPPRKIFSLTFTALQAMSIDDELMIVFSFSQKTKFDISCKLSTYEPGHSIDTIAYAPSKELERPAHPRNLIRPSLHMTLCLKLRILSLFRRTSDKPANGDAQTDQLSRVAHAIV